MVIAMNTRNMTKKIKVGNTFIGGQFTGIPGVYVPVSETVRGFKEILDGLHDDLPEEAFRMVGTIDDAIKKAKELTK